jgi:hypothetical protein
LSFTSAETRNAALDRNGDVDRNRLEDPTDPIEPGAPERTNLGCVRDLDAGEQLPDCNDGDRGGDEGCCFGFRRDENARVE